ncbi:MAG: TGS domain-containing protein [Firmicutes bacterium]|nr:TGS domain-containing protein [Bacillota bacterium]
MPANLTPQYLAAEQAFKQAKTVEEKIAALEEMLAVIPKHKGTEKLQADIKTRLSRLRSEAERRPRGARQDPFLIPKEGAGQVVLIGFPNSGKSSIVGTLTRAKVTIADYPFSTSLPVAGMMPYEDIMIQLVDMPPITSDGAMPGQAGAMRNSDAMLIVLDASSDDCVDQMEGCLGFMRERRILMEERIEGVRGITPDQCLIAVTKVDLPREFSLDERLDISFSSPALDNFRILEELGPRNIKMIPVSCKTGFNIELLRTWIFRVLGIIRIYSKIPGKEPDMDAPFILKDGATVIDMAAAVHRDFPQRLKHARIWGSARFPGQSVPRDYVLKDKDIVELHLA